MGKLHAILAVEPQLVLTAKALVSEAATQFTKHIERFKGQTRSIVFHDSLRDKENTSEKSLPSTTIDEKLDFVFPAIIESWDALLQKESTNQIAKADLVVDGKVLIKDCPSYWLLGLENRLKTLRELLITIPTLDPTLAWSDDPSLGKNIFKSQEVLQHKTEAVLSVLELSKATDKHPAQVEKVTTQRPVADIRTVTFSGMWSVTKKADTLARLDNLLASVKVSRMTANDTESSVRKESQKLFDYIRG